MSNFLKRLALFIGSFLNLRRKIDVAELSEDEKWVIKTRKVHGLEIARISLMTNISEAFLAAIALTESYPKLFKESSRVEPHIFRKLYNKNIYLYQDGKPYVNSEDIAIAATSHGLGQVMGYHAEEFRLLGKINGIGQCGTLDISIKDMREKPFEAMSKFIYYNAPSYLQEKDYKSIARIYNTGTPRETEAGNRYWSKIERYMKLYEKCLEIPEEDLPNI